MRNTLGLALPGLALGLLFFGSACRTEGDSRLLLDDLTSPTPLPDADRDGYTTSAGDCNDDDPSIHPEASEGTLDAGGHLIGDGIDNNCNGLIDDGTYGYDDDQDGYSEADGDCDDADGAVHPGILDGCDEIDNDCDGELDEDADDVFEPNDDLEEATDLGDITCTYDIYEINLDHETDVDYFTFTILDPGACGDREDAYGVTVELPTNETLDELNEPDFQPRFDFAMVLYREDEYGDLVVVAQTLSTVNDTYSISTSAGDGESLGTYYLMIGPSPSADEETDPIFCEDTTRLYVYGFSF